MAFGREQLEENIPTTLNFNIFSLCLIHHHSISIQFSYILQVFSSWVVTHSWYVHSKCTSMLYLRYFMVCFISNSRSFNLPSILCMKVRRMRWHLLSASDVHHKTAHDANTLPQWIHSNILTAIRRDDGISKTPNFTWCVGKSEPWTGCDVGLQRWRWWRNMKEDKKWKNMNPLL